MPKDLLVPGTSGNKLLLDNADLGWPSALAAQGWLAGTTGYALGLNGLPVSAAGIVSLMSMDFPDDTSALLPDKTTLKAGGAISPGPVLELVYNQFLDFDRFIYDFRADVRQSGQELLNHLLSKRPAGDKWRIACHSQGGLVVAVASKLYAKEKGNNDKAFSELVSHVAFIGVPFYGTISAAVALLQGEELSAGFAPHFKAIARTWPSLHQMLPVWPGCVRLKNLGNVTNALFDAMDPRAWPSANLDPAMLKRASQTRTEFLDSPLSRMNGVEKTVLMSKAWPTPNHLVIENGTTVVGPTLEPGDTLVPADTTYGAEGAVEQDVTHLFGQNGNTMKHFALSVDPFVATAVKDFFKR